MEHNTALDALLEHITFGTVAAAHNWPTAVKADTVNGKPILLYDGLKNEKMAIAYWLLDGLAFGDTPAPKWVKHDMLINGGLPICMFVDKQHAAPALVGSLKAEELDHVPIGFMDLHPCADGKYSVSGLGIAPPYQGKGLSKHLIHAGAVMAAMKQLIITTQLSNAKGHHSWLHLGPLELLHVKPLHDKNDTVVYAASVGDPARILQPIHDHAVWPIVEFSKLLQEPQKYIGWKVCHYAPTGLVLDADHDYGGCCSRGCGS